VQRVGECDESFEVGSRSDRPHDLGQAQMTPISFPSLAKVSSAPSI
jgi:hypothetical protein